MGRMMGKVIQILLSLFSPQYTESSETSTNMVGERDNGQCDFIVIPVSQALVSTINVSPQIFSG